jgi:hypothetical protein
LTTDETLADTGKFDKLRLNFTVTLLVMSDSWRMTRLLEAVKTYDKKAHSWHQLKRLAGVKKIFQLIGRLADGN